MSADMTMMIAKQVPGIREQLQAYVDPVRCSTVSSNIQSASSCTCKATASNTGSTLGDLLEVHVRHIALLEARIAEAFAAHPRAELFATLPGAGPVLAPRLLVGFGDQIARYPTAAPCKNTPGWPRCAKRADRNNGPTGAGPHRSSSAKASSNGRARPSCIALGPRLIISSNAGPAKPITPSCAHSPSNGSASFGAAGRMVCSTTKLATSPRLQNEALPWSPPRKIPEENPCVDYLSFWLSVGGGRGMILSRG